jgi:hypothetical protein
MPAFGIPSFRSTVDLESPRQREEVSMVTIMSLWLPILLSAVFVFVLSSVIHMVLPYHRSDVAAVPREEDVMAALRPFAIPPGDYIVPCPKTPGDMKSPEFQEKMNKGPVIFMTVRPTGVRGMGSNLVQWFLYCVLVSIFAAYVTSRAVAAGESYLHVFRFAGATAFCCYSVALLQDSIWWAKKWSTTLKSVFDGLIFALFTAGTFGWLWPH